MKQLIIPVNPQELGITANLIVLKKYGIDMQFIAKEALNGLVNSGNNYCSEILQYVNDAICQEFVTDSPASNYRVAEAIDEELEKYHDIVVTTVDALVNVMDEHLSAFNGIPLRHDVQSNKTYSLGPPHGGDIIIQINEG